MHPGATASTHPNPSSQSGHHRGGQQSAVHRSALSGRWRVLSQQEASQKRAHQKTLLEAVKLLSNSLSSLQCAELESDSAPPPPSFAAATSSSVLEYPARSMSGRAASNTLEGKAGATDANPVKAANIRAVNTMPNQATPGQRMLGHGETLAAPILQGLCGAQELKGHVMTACQLVEPGMGYAGTTAANTGMAPCAVPCQHLLLLSSSMLLASDALPAPALSPLHVCPPPAPSSLPPPPPPPALPLYPSPAPLRVCLLPMFTFPPALRPSPFQKQYLENSNKQGRVEGLPRTCMHLHKCQGLLSLMMIL